MPNQDNDTEMLRVMGNTITNLQIQYRSASLEEQGNLCTPLKDMLQNYGKYLTRLLKAGTITTDAELAEMKAIQNSISEKARLQDLLIAIAKIAALIASA